VSTLLPGWLFGVATVLFMALVWWLIDWLRGDKS